VKRPVLLLLVLSLLFGAHLLRADTVQGYVINPATGVLAAHTGVAFMLSQGGQLSEVLRKDTDAEGRFSFAGPFITADLSFVLVAFYQGLPFPSAELKVGAQKEVILEVYDAQGSRDQLSIAAHQLFLLLSEKGIEAVHMVRIENRGDQAYAGHGQGEERRVTEFALPAGAFNLQSFSGHVSQISDTQAFDTQPLPPGNTQIAFSFQMDLPQHDGEYLHQVLYPTAALEAYVFPATLSPKPPFADLGEQPIQGKVYRRMRAENLAPGQNLTIPVPTPPNLGWVLKWAALGLVGAVALAAAWSAVRPSGGSTGPAPLADQGREALEKERQSLLLRLARLDDTYQSRSNDRHYRTQRARLFGQLLALYRLLDAQDDPR
jgi:hypothetical protein